jgi:hypothetical protein
MKLAASVVSVLLVSTWELIEGLVKKSVCVMRYSRQSVHMTALISKEFSSVPVPGDLC